MAQAVIDKIRLEGNGLTTQGYYSFETTSITISETPKETFQITPSHTMNTVSYTHLDVYKRQTFHCARHSFITNIMANGANIKTAASLAGHSTTRHTEKYVHIIDELKQKAVDSLPDIIVNYK